MTDLLYPLSPSNVEADKLLPSTAFKKQVGKVITSIIFFLFVYILLLAAATGLAIGFFYLGITLILAVPRFITLVFGAGLMAVGLSVIFFLIKFIFAVSKNENDSRILVTETNQPELFAFIRKLTDETNTPFPKKIYLSDAVNASVFYNSSFWSMFFPVRKNLEIGLGLVNCINVSEFKAVMAHEFGHFSQRSMKLGSFTYNVNRVIYNMLYQNSGYTKFLDSWGKLHGALAFCAAITVKISQGIQWILKQVYQVVNKNYLGLSREMEFHADAVAASVSGGNNLVTALGRIEVAASCYNTALYNANELLQQNKRSKNIFSNQLAVFQFLAKDHQLPIKQELPEVSYHFIQTISKSRVNYINQWASHPTMQERTSRLEKLAIDIEADETRAWQLFENPESMQERMTLHLYKTATPENETEEYDAGFFEEWYNKKRTELVLPAAYNGFYDGRFVTSTSWDLEAIGNVPNSENFDSLFSEKNGKLQSAINVNETDLDTLRAIQSKQIDVNSFDFDGVKYMVADVATIIEQLEKEISDQKAQQSILDKEAYSFFYNKAGHNSAGVRNLYLAYQQLERQKDQYNELAHNIMNTVRPFYNGNLTLEEVLAGVEKLRDNYQVTLKQQFQLFLDEKIITHESQEELYNKITHFNSVSYAYFISNEFQSNELNDLCDLVIKVAEELNTHKFNGYKKLVIEQLGF